MIRKFNEFVAKESFDADKDNYNKLLYMFLLHDILDDITAHGHIHYYNPLYIKRIDSLVSEIDSRFMSELKLFAKNNGLDEDKIFSNLNKDVIKEIKKYYEKSITYHK